MASSVAMALASGPARAAIVASENFEAAANGSTLAAGAAVVGTWSNIALGEVGSALEITAGGSSPLASGSQGLRLVDKPGEATGNLGVGGNPGARLGLITPLVVGATATDYLDVSVDFLMTDATKFSNVVFRVSGSGGSSETAGALVMDRVAAGNLYYLTFTTSANATVSPGAVGTGLSASTWFRVMMSFDTVNRTYSGTLFNGTTTSTLFSNVNFGNSTAVDDISAISIGDNSNNADGGEIFIDNIVASTRAVPEPASMGLLAPLLVALRRRR